MPKLMCMTRLSDLPLDELENRLIELGFVEGASVKILHEGPFSGDPEEYVCTVSVTNFDPETNTYVDKDPEEMVKFLDKKSR